MRYEKTGKDILTISNGQYGNGVYWRIQKVAGVYYYDTQHYDDVFGWLWDNIYRSVDLAPVLEARNNDLRKWGNYIDKSI